MISLFFLLVLINLEVVDAWRQSSFNLNNNVAPRYRQNGYYDYSNSDYDGGQAPLFEVTLPSFPRKIKIQIPSTRKIPLNPGYTTSTQVLPATIQPRTAVLSNHQIQTLKNALVEPTTIANFQLRANSVEHSVESPKIKLIRIDIRVPSFENVDTATFRRNLARRLSFLLPMLYALDGADSLLNGKSYSEELYYSDVLILESHRVNDTATDRVYVDFAVILNSTIIEPSLASSLIQFRYNKDKLSHLIGYPVFDGPKAVTRTTLSLTDGIGVDQKLRIEFENFAIVDDAFFTLINKWIDGYVLPMTRNLSNATMDASAMVTSIHSASNTTSVDFIIHLGAIHRSSQELAKALFFISPISLQSLIEFTILTGGYLEIDENNQTKFTKLYNRAEDYFYPTAKMEVFQSVNTSSNRSSLPIEIDQKARFVFNASVSSNLDRIELEVRRWIMSNVVLFVKSKLNTNLNASAKIFNSTAFSADNKTFSVDFAIIFAFPPTPIAVNTSILKDILFLEENFEALKSDSPFPIIAGGYIAQNSSGSYFIIASSNRSVSLPSPTLTADTTIKSPTLTANETDVDFAHVSRESKMSSPKIDAADLLISRSFPETDQIARIIFEIPEVKYGINYTEVGLNIKRWLESHVAPLIQRSFGANASAFISIYNASYLNLTFTVDFAVLFIDPPKQLVANATDLVFDLFSDSLETTLASTPFKILSGGYLQKTEEGRSEKTYNFVILYSSSGGMILLGWTPPLFETKHLLQIDLKIPLAINTSSTSFKQLISDRLRGIILPILQRPGVVDSLAADSLRYAQEHGVYDIKIIEVVRTGLAETDMEKTAIKFLVIYNSSLLNGGMTANALGLNMDGDLLQQKIGFKVLMAPTAVSSIRPEPYKEPESQLWIIAAVLVPIILVIILINICILTCCKPGRQQRQTPKKLDNSGLPLSTSSQNVNFAQQQPYPYIYYYQPVLVPPGEEKPKENVVTPKAAEQTTSVPSSPEASLPSVSPPPKVSYQLLPKVRRATNGKRNKLRRRQIRPVDQANAAVISQVASSLLREAFRNLSIEQLPGNLAHTVSSDEPHAPSAHDQVCQTDDSVLRTLGQQLGSEQPWTREYERSLLRLASLVVSPNGVQMQPPNASAPVPIIDLTKGRTSLPEHGATIAQALKQQAAKASPEDPDTSPSVEVDSIDDAKYKKKDDENVDLDETQVKQIERLNALFLGMPPVNADIQPAETVSASQLGDRPMQTKKRDFSDEHDVIVNSLRPGVPPRRLLEAIRLELESYGKK